MRPDPPQVFVRVRRVKSYGLPPWVDIALAAWFIFLASIPFVIIGWALWDEFS